VALHEFLESLLAADGDDDVARLSPAGAEQAGEQRLADLSRARIAILRFVAIGAV
jgi:hypothetical protein